MKTQLFNSVDLIIAPVVLCILWVTMAIFRKKQPSVLQQYFWKAFLLRIVGTFTLAAIYQFVYASGDTFGYYFNTQFLTSYFFKNPLLYFNIIFSNPAIETDVMTEFMNRIEDFNRFLPLVFHNTENANVSKLASVFNIICFDSYLGVALFFSTLSFIGCWYIFKTFIYIFPGYEKYFAGVCLYLPSLWFWGSGILKDPLCIFGLGILFYNFFVKEKSLIKRISWMMLGAFILSTIKSYIFYSFLAAAVLGYSYQYFRTTSVLKKVIILLLFGIAVIGAYRVLSEVIAQAFADMIEQSMYFAKSYSDTSAEGGSNEIPIIDPTPAGFIKLSVQGLVNVFLKPFPWDIRKILYLFVILENMLLYYIIFRKIKDGPIIFRKNYRYLLYFCFVFFLFLGAVIGVTTFNLGTIARYRVPALPFLFAGFFCLKLAARKRKINKVDKVELSLNKKS